MGAVCAVCLTHFVHATSEIYSPPPFEHYQPILDRMPFGVLPPNFNAAAADAATLKSEEQVKVEQQKLAKQVNMSAVNVTPDGGTAIGFTDLSQKPPVNYYLLVGSEADGWKVLSADFDEEIATIEKEGVTVTLKLGQGLVDPAAPAAAAAGKPALPHTRSPLLIRPALVPPVAAAAEARPGALRSLGITGATLRGLTSKDHPSEKAEDPRSYAERLRERTTQQTQAQLAAEEKMREQFEKLARETATREIRRREEEAAQAAQAQEQQEEPAPAEAPEPPPQPAE